jgi:general secretion pathway protein G
MMTPGREQGATRFEFAVCAFVMAVLAGALLGRVLEWRAESERSAAYHVVGAMRTALAARATQLGMRGGEPAIFALMQENPMTWLVRQPANYLGEYYSPDLDALRRGAWFFDRTDRSVNYVLGSDTFSSGTSKLLKFKVELSSSSHPAGSSGRSGNHNALVIDEVGAGAKK